jgi:sensor histidine kinase YesM
MRLHIDIGGNSQTSVLLNVDFSNSMYTTFGHYVWHQSHPKKRTKTPFLLHPRQSTNSNLFHFIFAIAHYKKTAIGFTSFVKKVILIIMKLFYTATALWLASFVPTATSFSLDGLLAFLTTGNEILDTHVHPTKAATSSPNEILAHEDATTVNPPREITSTSS